jgi:hypothetical protein
LLLATDTLRADPFSPRRRDIVWLAWAATLAYLLHQFEEHGVDAQGAPYAFRGSLCATLGFPDAAACPIPLAFITAVNISAVWIAGPASALLGRIWPAIALSFFSVPFVNAFAHIGPAIAHRAYNPGLLTAVVLFLPLSLWTFRVAVRRADLGWRAVLATIAGGVVIHAILLASLQAHIQGWIGLPALVLIQVVNPAIPALIVVFVTMRSRAARGGRPGALLSTQPPSA